MFSVLSCIVGQHDLRLVVLAALICATACCAAFGSHLRSLRSGGSARWAWVALTALEAGAGVWATHFIAMLAYLPSVRTGYDTGVTALSLGICVVGMGGAFSVPLLARGRIGALAGGALAGLAISAMHFTGIAALRAQAEVGWNMPYVVAAIAISILGGAAAFYLRTRLRGRTAWTLPATVMVLAIVGLHFTAMTAIVLQPDPTLEIPTEMVGRGALALTTAVLTGLIFAVAISLGWMEGMGRRSTLTSLRHALNAMPGGLAFFDHEDRLIAWNGAFANLLALCGQEMQRGRSRRELLAATLQAGWFDGVDPDPAMQDAGAHWADRDATEFRLADGRWFRVETFRTHDGGGSVVVSDITAQVESAAAMVAARDAAEAANAAKSAFLANISHEIRTPLNGVLGVAEVLGRTRLAPKQRELVGVIQNSGALLNGLLGDLLDLARVEARAVALRPEPTDLGELLAQVRDLFAAQAEAKALSLELEIGAGAGDRVSCDPLRLRQVIGNLVSNAIKFTAAGRVVITAARDGDEVSFEVRDTGEGFDPAVKARLFERFQQADAASTRKHGGAGLGLAISQEYVRMMGGELDASSLPGVGSVFGFSIRLPRLAAEVPRPAVVAHPEPAEAGRFRVLVVDDNAVNRQVLGLILDAVGIEHADAEDGQEGLEAVTTGSFDAVLMDLQMPVMDGFESMRRIRAWEAQAHRPRMPIYVVSANCLDEHVLKGAEAGADGHLAKPVSVDQLLGVLSPHAEAARHAA